MDTTLHNFGVEKLIGKWDVINFGLFEVKDSLLTDSKIYYRSSKILNEQKGNNGYITFTEKRFKTSLIDNKEIPNKSKLYTKSLTGFCGATIIGLTKDGLLIIDDHTYRTLAKKERYLTVKTSIRRMILRRSTTA
jgi:hypothetical protein